MHHLVPLKTKIWIVVVLAAVIAGAANLVGFGGLWLSVVVGTIDWIVVYVLMQSWSALAGLPEQIPRPAWMKHDLSGKWNALIHSRQYPPNTSEKIFEGTLDLHQGW